MPQGMGVLLGRACASGPSVAYGVFAVHHGVACRYTVLGPTKGGAVRTLRVETRSEWRQWLEEHHASETEIWFVFYKKHTGVANVAYGDAVEEALCFGWIDSLVKRLDDDRYAQKFTPRRPGSVWSEPNKARVERMIAQGRMAEPGLRLVNEAKASGEWENRHERPKADVDLVPEELQAALNANPAAAETFQALAPTYRKQYILWIATAKRQETRARRTREAIDKLERGERLGLK